MRSSDILPTSSASLLTSRNSCSVVDCRVELKEELQARTSALDAIFYSSIFLCSSHVRRTRTRVRAYAYTYVRVRDRGVVHMRLRMPSRVHVGICISIFAHIWFYLFSFFDFYLSTLYRMENTHKTQKVVLEQ